MKRGGVCVVSSLAMGENVGQRDMWLLLLTHDGSRTV
jgi:hypothetical protein